VEYEEHILLEEVAVKIYFDKDKAFTSLWLE
jgi:hypothetical protein